MRTPFSATISFAARGLALATVGIAGITPASLRSQEGSAWANTPARPARVAAAVAAPINQRIGDESFAAAFGDRVNPAEAGEDLRIRTHLAHVERMLREREVPGASAELRCARERNLDLLREYHQRGEFPRNYDHPEERRPCFIDRDGRICAVGYLVERTAGRELAESINRKFQYELLGDMQYERLATWVAASGLSLDELATIQPQYGPGDATCYAWGTSCFSSGTVPTYVVSDPAQHWGGSWVPWFSWWMPAPPGAQWLGAANLYYTPDVEWTLAFDLTGFDPSTVALTGTWSATPGTSILLNGTPTGIALSAQTSWTTPQPFAIQSGFVAGVNVLHFRARNTGYEILGLLVASLTATAEANGVRQTVPGLFATGVDGQNAALPGGALDPHYRVNEPPLRAQGLPRFGNGSFALTVDAGPQRMVILALSDYGWRSIDLGFGCVTWLEPSMLITAPAVTDATGRASFSLPVPPLQCYWCAHQALAQAIVEDPSAPLGGFGLTQHLEIWAGF